MLEGHVNPSVSQQNRTEYQSDWKCFHHGDCQVDVLSPAVCLLSCAWSVHMMLIFRRRSLTRLTRFHQDHQRTATGPKPCPPSTFVCRHAPRTDNRPLLEELNAHGRKRFRRMAEGHKATLNLLPGTVFLTPEREASRVQLVSIVPADVSRLTSRDTVFDLIILGSVCIIVLQGA